MKNLFLSLLFLTGLITATSCSDEFETKQDVEFFTELSLSAPEQNVVAGNNTFAWNFFAKNCEMNNGRNFAVSPLSVSIAMTMLANGATEDSPARKEILHTLGYDGLNISDVNSCAIKLADGIGRLDKGVIMNLSNSLWINPINITLNPEYSSLLKNDFSAEACQINESSFVSDVNKWCENKTNGMIKELLPEGFTAPDMALINATYFKGAWGKDYKFKKEDTAKGKFQNIDGTTSDVMFMTLNERFMCHSEAEFKYIEIPFGDGTYVFGIVRPNDGFTLLDCASVISNGKWENIISHASTYPLPLELKMPKFDIEFKTDLKNMLGEMGMKYAVEKIDYFFASPMGFQVKSIMHQTNIRVNEEGAEAAAVTDINNATASVNDKYIPFHLDSPFIYLIREKTTGSIIFIGCINGF